MNNYFIKLNNFIDFFSFIWAMDSWTTFLFIYPSPPLFSWSVNACLLVFHQLLVYSIFFPYLYYYVNDSRFTYFLSSSIRRLFYIFDFLFIFLLVSLFYIFCFYCLTCFKSNINYYFCQYYLCFNRGNFIKKPRKITYGASQIFTILNLF